MDPLCAKALFVLGFIGIGVIRGPHGRRSKAVKVAESRRGTLELVLLALMWLASLIFPALWLFTRLFAFADHPLRPAPFAAGAALEAAGLWLLYRSHADLGANWSITLETRENHGLVTSGVYRRVRHPMYTSFFLLAFAQALYLPNWFVGWFYPCAFALMFALRLAPEEKMMLDRFGAAYEDYRARTRRLIPGLW